VHKFCLELVLLVFVDSLQKYQELLLARNSSKQILAPHLQDVKELDVVGVGETVLYGDREEFLFVLVQFVVVHVH